MSDVQVINQMAPIEEIVIPEIGLIEIETDDVGPDASYYVDFGLMARAILPIHYAFARLVKIPIIFRPDISQYESFDNTLNEWWSTASDNMRLALIDYTNHHNSMGQYMYDDLHVPVSRLVHDFYAEKVGIKDFNHSFPPSDTSINFPKYKDVRKLSSKEIKVLRNPEFFVPEMKNRIHDSMKTLFSNLAKMYEMMDEVTARAGQSQKDIRAGYEEIYSEARFRHFNDVIVDSSQMAAAAKKIYSKEAKKVVKRSVKRLEQTIGEVNTKLFFSQKEVHVDGNEFSFRVSKRRNVNILSHSDSPKNYNSVPYVLELYDNQGNYLAEGCLVFPGVPVLDQISSLHLLVKAGLEKDIVDKTVWYSTSERFKRATNEVIIDKITKPSLRNFSRKRHILGRVKGKANMARRRMNKYIKAEINYILNYIDKNNLYPVFLDRNDANRR